MLLPLAAASTSSCLRISGGIRNENGDVSPAKSPLGFLPAPVARLRFIYCSLICDTPVLFAYCNSERNRILGDNHDLSGGCPMKGVAKEISEVEQILTDLRTRPAVPVYPHFSYISGIARE